MSEVLVVDNSKWFTSLVAEKIESGLNFPVKTAQTYNQAIDLIDSETSDFFVSLLGLYHEDAEMGAIVDFAISRSIPVIVYTGKFNDALRETILSRKVIDYVIKEDKHSLDYIVSLIRRIKRNETIKVLVVDDSTTARNHISGLLDVHRFRVFKAEDGASAERILADHTDIKLIITDYNMPNMDGFKLIRNVRKQYTKENLAIIGVSGDSNSKLSARFIKNGANDFLTKPFLAEEFYCRITQNIEMIERMHEIREMTNKDELTGLSSRKYFLENGDRFMKDMRERNQPLFVSIIGIDDMRMINDEFGFDAGDQALLNTARIIRQNFPNSVLVSRIGGDEFGVVSLLKENENLKERLETIRGKIEAAELIVSGKKVAYTASIGVCARTADTFGHMVVRAEKMMLAAKDDGRNKVVMDG